MTDSLPQRLEPVDVYPHERRLTAQGRWVAADDLRRHDLLATRVGGQAELADIRFRNAAVVVYNLQVADLHTYAVGRAGLLVHNKLLDDEPPRTLQSGGNKINDSTARALGLRKREAGRAVENIKDARRLPNDYHGKIMSNGDYIDPHTGNKWGNIYEYLD